MKVDRVSFEQISADEWTRLLSRSEVNTSFLTHEWLSTYWDEFCTGELLLLKVSDSSDELIGIAPLMMDRGKISFIGMPHADYSDFITARDRSDVLSRIFKYITEEVNWKSIYLTEIPEYSSTPNSIRQLPELSGLHQHTSLANICYEMDFKKDDMKQIKKKLKKRDVSRHIKSLKKKGSISTELVRDAGEDVIAMMFKQHQAIWHSRNMSSMFEDEKNQAFFQNLYKNMPEAILWLLKFDGQIISIEFGFERAGRYIAYCQSFDMEYRIHSPGIVLLKYIMDHYIDLEYNMVDLSRGAEQYKTRFCNNQTRNQEVNIHRSWVKHMCSNGYSLVKSSILARPKWHDRYTKVRNKIGF